MAPFKFEKKKKDNRGGGGGGVEPLKQSQSSQCCVPKGKGLVTIYDYFHYNEFFMKC